MTSKLEYTPEQLLEMLEKTFGKNTDGEYALLHTTAKPDSCLYTLYANPIATPSLAYNPRIRDGFKFEVHSADKERVLLDTPEDTHDLLVLANNPHYQVKKIYHKNGRLCAIVENGLTTLKIQDHLPTPKEIQNAFKPLKAKPTYITVKGRELTEQKPTLRKPSPDGKKQTESQIIQKIKTRFQKN